MHYSSRLLALALAAAAGTGAVPTPEQQSPTISRRAVPVGQIITSCTVPGTVALTFDDGPYIYTGQALDQLGAAGFKATFFLNGQNWGSISDYASTVVRMRNEGHQVGSHTWSHADLATLDSAGVTSQMTMLEDALVGIIGVRPTYMRPPYLSTNSMVLSTLGGLGYHVISIDIDTLDYNLQGNIAQAAANFEAGLNAGGSISLAHDVHQNTVQQLIGMLIQKVQQRGLTPVTVGECLGDPAANWYAGARGTTPPTDPTDPTDPGSSLPTSPDSTCGAAAGYRCPSGECCSQWGWCGTTSEYCASGCQSAFGNCS